MNEESHNPWTDPELEARIVAFVLGEASDFEREELNRLMAEWPDLAAFKEKIQNVHGLLQQAATEELVPGDDDWKLSAEKRSVVLAAIEGETKEQSAEYVVTLARREEQRVMRRGRFANLTKVAAALCVAGLLAVLTIPGLFEGAVGKGRARLRQLGLAEHNYHDAVKSRLPNRGGIFSSEREESPLVSSIAYGPSSTMSADFTYQRTASPASDGFDLANGTRSALSAIRGTLDAGGALPSPYYLSDDVQYVPADRDFKLPPGEATPRFATDGDENRLRAPTADVEGLASGLSTLGVNVNGAAGVTGRVTTDEANSAFGLDGKGARPTDQPSRASNSDGDGLSFPEFEAGGGDRNSSRPAVTAGTIVSVPDEGTVLLGGIKRLESKQKAFEAASETAGSSRMGVEFYGEAKSGEEWSEAAGPREPALGDSPVVINGVASSGELPALGLGARGLGAGGLESKDLEGRGSGQQQGAARGQPQISGGTTLALPDDPQSSLAADRALTRDMADGGIAADSSRNGQADGEGDAWMDSTSEAAPETEADAWRKANALANSPTAPASDPQNIKSAQDHIGIVGLRAEEAVKQRIITMSSNDDISLHIAPGLEPEPAYNIEIPRAGFAADPVVNPDRRHVRVAPIPMTGTAVGGKPLGESRGELANQDRFEAFARESNWYSGRGGRDFGTKSSTAHAAKVPDQPTTITGGNESRAVEELAKEALKELAELSDVEKNLDVDGERLEDTYYENNTLYGYPSQSERGGEREEPLSQRDQVAAFGRDQWGAYTPKLLLGKSGSMTMWKGKAAVPTGLIEKSAQEEAFSTFSLHVSDVSFKLAQAALAMGQWPEAAKVRIEEFVNAFDYGDPLPTRNEKVACRVEQSTHPFLQQRNLLRISMRTAAAGRSSNTPLRLTFVLDNSGSMERPDRRQTVRRAFSLLVQQLKPIDQVTLISFARQPRLLADKVSGAQSQQLLELIANLPSEGGTNIESALLLAFEKASEQQVDGAQNRIILLTDGAVNLGDADPENLSLMVTTMRHAGIAFDAAGICAEGLNDEVLEALTHKGDGRYYLLDSMEAADDGFARQIAGALRPSAKNVKVQVEFNPKRVSRYRLLGFEKHRLNREDFRDDSVDAAEMAAAEAGVAVYQFQTKHDGEGDVGSVSVRFRDLSTGEMVEKRWPIPYESGAPRLDQAAHSLRIAASAALFAAKLRGEALGETVDLKTLSDLIAGLPDRDRHTAQIQQLQQMIHQARQVAGK